MGGGGPSKHLQCSQRSTLNCPPHLGTCSAVPWTLPLSIQNKQVVALPFPFWAEALPLLYLVLPHLSSLIFTQHPHPPNSQFYVLRCIFFTICIEFIIFQLVQEISKEEGKKKRRGSYLHSIYFIIVLLSPK